MDTFGETHATLKNELFIFTEELDDEAAAPKQ